MAHSDVIAKCIAGKEGTHVKKILEESVFPIQLSVEQYDFTNDGTAEVAALTRLQPAGPPDDPMPAHLPLPLYYLLNVDGDNTWDMVYKDTEAENNIRITEDYNCDWIQPLDVPKEDIQNSWRFWYLLEIQPKEES